MTERPLFDKPVPSSVKPRGCPATKLLRPPVLPVTPKAAPEKWVIELTAAPGGEVPPVCRVKRLIKSAWRRYRLRVTFVADKEFSTPAPHDSAGQDKPMASKACIGVDKVQRGPQTAFNEAAEDVK